MRHRPPPWEDAYIEFFDARQQSFMRTAYAIVGGWPAAEDATQETFSTLYVYWPRIRTSVDAYARRVLVNACMSVLRGRRHESLTDAVPDAVVDRDDSERVDLMRALAQLTPRDRAVIALRYLDDLSVAEVAHVLDLPTGTVKSQCARAMGRLRDLMPVEARKEMP